MRYDLSLPQPASVRGFLSKVTHQNLLPVLSSSLFDFGRYALMAY